MKDPLKKVSEKVFELELGRPLPLWVPLALYPLLLAMGGGWFYADVGLTLFKLIIMSGFMTLLFFGSMLLRQYASLRPRSLRFDNAEAVYTITQDNGLSREEGYGTIERFAHRRKSRNRYTVFIMRKDGSFFDLMVTSSRRRARLLDESLGKSIELRTKELKPEPALLGALSEDELAGKKRILWQETYSFKAGLWISGLLLGLSLILWGFGLEEKLFSFTSPGFYLGFGLLQAALMLWTMRQLKLQHIVQLEENRIAYRRAYSDHPEAGDEITALDPAKIHSLDYSFDLEQGIQQLMALDKSEAEEILRMRTGDFKIKDMTRLYSRKRKAFKIPLTGLGVVEAMALKDFLNHALKKT